MGHCEAHHPILAAIDLGTNSCRLLVASVNVATLKKSFLRRRPNLIGWKIIDSFARIVRLGEGLHQTNELSLEAIDRTIDALKICKRKIDYHHATRVRAVATEACRRATNGHVLVERALVELDLNIEIISSHEEAKLALTGCAAILDPKIPYAIAFDIGGGSTEVIWLKMKPEERKRPGYPIPFEVIDSFSIPYGVVTVSESYAQFASSPEIHHDVRTFVHNELLAFVHRNDIDRYIEKDQVQLIGSSGTVTTLVAVQIGLPKYERSLVDGLFITIKDIHEISHNILMMSKKERAEHPCIGGGRADLVIVGSAILQGICDAIPVTDLRVADRGVREGILSELLMAIQSPRRY